MSGAAEAPGRRSLAQLLARFAGPVELVLDVVAWVLAAFVAMLFRFEFHIPSIWRRGLLEALPLVIGVQLAVGLAVGLYRRRWRYGSFDEATALLATSGLTTLVIAVVNYWVLTERLIPMSVVWFAGVVGLVGMAGVRYGWRLLADRRRRPGASAERLVVFGAGEAGTQMVANMLSSPNSPFLPVAMLDDDPGKRRLTIRGVPVAGDRRDLEKVAQRFEATSLLIAAPSADAALVQALTDDANRVGLKVKVLPSVGELFGAMPDLGDIRDVTEADLMGRTQVDLDLDAISTYLTGRRVLVTGAGGSIGSELCRQLARCNPAELLMLDRDESALHGLQLSLSGRAFLDTPEVILCDIRDAHSVSRVFAERRPEVVFHAAALKHLPMLEQYPSEAVKANVWGTRNVLEAARAVGVERFVNVSTDKAANPISVLGWSKRVAERLTAGVSDGGGVYLSVRFGNVLNSRGSVVATFTNQIERGGPITVTHPDVTRFFMTIPEAVQLVIQAGAIGRQGEVLVLDMGKPVRIIDVARQMIEQSRRPIEIVITHLRQGEKVHEELFGTGEVDERPFHPLISHAGVPSLGIRAVDLEVDTMGDAEIREWLAGLSAFPVDEPGLLPR